MAATGVHIHEHHRLRQEQGEYAGSHRLAGALVMKVMTLLIEPLIPALRRYAHGLMRDRATADDLVQDCLERAISRWHQRREDNDPRSWIFTILHNLAINRMRQKQRRGPHIPLEDADEDSLA